MWKKQGTTPKYDTLKKISDYFGVSVDYLLALTPEEQAELQYIEDYVVEQTEQERAAVRTLLLKEKIADIPHERYINAIDIADKAVIEKFKFIPDSQLKKYILDDYQFLNRRGRIEAAIRIAELLENCRFKLNQNAPKSTETALEGKDTTPDETPTETPQNPPEDET